jgi:hypothetical protein
MWTADASRRADLRHPLAQRRDRDLAADDDQGDEGMQSAEVDEDEERRGDEELVGDRVEKGAERRRHRSLRASQPSAQSVRAKTMKRAVPTTF